MVADEYPWPARTGYRLRLDAVVRALADAGSVDLIAAVLDARTGRDDPPHDVPLRRCVPVVAGPRREGSARRALRWAGGSLPRALLWRDWEPVRAVLRSWLVDGPYDAVWFSHAPVYIALSDLVPRHSIVDLDNLDSFLLRHRRGHRGRVLATADRIDERRWLGLQERIAAAADAIVVCSELDRGRLGAANAVVVPNGYERPDGTPAPAPVRRPGTAPVLLMVGLLTYEANRDGAEFFATQILPQVRAGIPAAAFRLVGRFDDETQVARLRGAIGVSVAGEVPDIRPELAAADVAVVPVRFGGGTRIKILEAFAYGVPVVATTVGCEGLDVVDGEHLLVADDPESFAQACVRVLTDDAVRAKLVTNARALWNQQYRWHTIRPAITALAQRVGEG